MIYFRGSDLIYAGPTVLNTILIVFFIGWNKFYPYKMRRAYGSKIQPR
jgi:hypothetical protein